jgi:hypothetical protein
MSGKRRIKSGEVIPLILTIAVLSSCDRLKSTSGAPPNIDISEARKLGDSVTSDVLRHDLKDLHKKLEKPFRDLANEENLNSMLMQMIQVYGRPVDFEFKKQELSSKVYPDGTSKVMRELWYSTQTTKYEKGSHFLLIEVVPDEGTLAVSSFAIVNFPLGIPETLQ